MIRKLYLFLRYRMWGTKIPPWERDNFKPYQLKKIA